MAKEAKAAACTMMTTMPGEKGGWHAPPAAPHGKGGAEHWEKGGWHAQPAPPATPEPPQEMRPSTQLNASQIKWSVLGRPLFRSNRGNWACAWACTRTHAVSPCATCSTRLFAFCKKDDQDD